MTKNALSLILAWIIVILVIMVLGVWKTQAHMPDRPDLNDWFGSLRSKQAICCSFADAETIADPDWDTHDGHYRVRLDGKWFDVSDDAVIQEPNKYGPAIVWPLRYDGKVYSIRCFMPGAGT